MQDKRGATEPAAESWLAALPLAAALLDMDTAGNFSFAIRNRGFNDARVAMATPASHQALADAVAQLAQGTAPPPFEINEGLGPTARLYRATLTAISPQRALLVLVDETRMRAAARHLHLEMTNDSLTGLPNRVGFDEAIEAAVASGNGPFLLILLDVLRFSRINEAIGRLAGDEFLMTLAHCVRGQLPRETTVSRTGSNEFAVLTPLKADDPDEIAAFLNRLTTCFERPCQIDGFDLGAECAVGYSVIERDTTASVDELFGEAQIALKRAKQTGSIQRYMPTDASAVIDRFSIETNLRRAIADGALMLHYQPLLELETGRVAGFEALLRWTFEGRRMSPAVFVAVAEESRLIEQIGHWAIEEAASTLAAWDHRAGRQLPVFIGVNVSPLQLVRHGLVDYTADVLRRHGLNGHRLSLEITESAVIADPTRAATMLGEFKALDLSISMDDFGTGYSNLASLRRLPIDVLKIDASLVTDMLDDDDKVAIVRAILSMAQAIGLKTTAEGIETLELADLLKQMGCTYGQGYCFAPALPSDEAYEFLARSAAQS